MAVRVDLNISLDGFATTTDQTVENPMGPESDYEVTAESGTVHLTFRR